MTQSGHERAAFAALTCYSHSREGIQMASGSRAFALTAILSAWLTSAAVPESFQVGCSSLPFSAQTEARPIDHTCGNGGSTQTGPKGIQNRLKNNLCSTGQPTTLTFEDFRSLQEQVRTLNITFGATFSGGERVEHFPQDRSELSSGKLHTLGGRPINEGDKVQIVALMEDPHYSDVGPGKGEDVNCHNETEEGNDIHITLVETPAPPKPGKDDPNAAQKEAAFNEVLCTGIVAEVIPHFRPKAFEVNVLAPIADQHIPVRISGQLFFDASHHPCLGPAPGRGDPARASLWEIHPIYSIDVCRNRTLGECPAADEAVWTPIRQ
jgi:hypothetical protein